MTDEQHRQLLWRWRDACVAVGVAPADGPDILGVSIDTRSLQPGDLFVALLGDPGPRFNTDSRTDRDGHAFIDEAQRRGAVGALTHRASGTSLPELRVADTLDGLWALGRGARARFTGPVFAVTGSSGKTTVRSFLAQALGCAPATGSLNNFWGVPLSLARTPVSAPAAVLEIGTNHPGEIEPLSKLVMPTVALVLNVRAAHLQYFGSIDALRREKVSIYNGIVGNGVAVLPDDLDTSGVRGDVRRMTFGRSLAADVALLAYRGETRTATYRVGGRSYEARVPGGGEHRAISLAAVLACLTAAEQSLDGALNLPDSIVPEGRGSRISIGGVEIIDDSYNANPTSMAAALHGLVAESARRTFAILGEMRELGDDGPAFHRDLAPHCKGVAHIVCVGKGMDPLWDALPADQRLMKADTADQLPLSEFVANLQPGDVVLVKGSNRVFWVNGFVQKFVDALKERSTSVA
jgi:UDP-N-acetylmuramoyl-tripeptide--D-alanyl-D-alanine ligase